MGVSEGAFRNWILFFAAKSSILNLRDGRWIRQDDRIDSSGFGWESRAVCRT